MRRTHSVFSVTFTYGAMKQKIRIGLEIAVLAAVLGAASATQAEQETVVLQGMDTSTNSTAAQVPSGKLPQQISQMPVTPLVRSSEPQLSRILKVGEHQSPNSNQDNVEIIAKVHPHALSGRQAATLYLRNIPVLTFLGTPSKTQPGVKMGTESNADVTSSPSAQDKTLSSVTPATPPSQWQKVSTTSKENTAANSLGDPILRATAVAAQLNQLHREKLDASQITVQWSAAKGQPAGSRDRYTIKAKDKTLVVLDGTAFLPEKAKNRETAALEVTNRLRRLMGNAKPLQAVAGKPRPQRQQVLALGPVRFYSDGMASWYGPGFHGNLSASGEPFNQYDMTAAHRTLPFGTRVRVTNADNGRSVVVRINDRGPFTGGRVIDLSKGAAQVIGLMSSGVAPVRLEILGR